MSWLNETREEIKLTSPDGKIFYALWKSGERSVDKKLGQFDPPNFRGTITQDLGVKSDMYPITIYFDGPFHNGTSENFFKACKEVGQWEVIHPVKGPLILQLISCKEVMDPIGAGNYTQLDTSWLEPANQERIISPVESIQNTLSQIIVSIEDSYLIAKQMQASTYSLLQAGISQFQSIIGLGTKFFTSMIASNAETLDLFESTKTSVLAMLDDYNNIDFEEVTASIMTLLHAPIESSTDFNTRNTAYQNFINDLLVSVPATSNVEDRNKLFAIEIGVTAAIIAIAKVTVTSDYASRADIVSAMENITNIFNDTVAAMDEAQDGFSALDIDFQYFSQTQTYTALVTLMAYAMEYLLQQFYNLKVEKRFVIKKMRSPLEIAITEYQPTLDKIDFYYSLFLASNNLSGDKILLLPAHTEVVIYV